MTHCHKCGAKQVKRKTKAERRAEARANLERLKRVAATSPVSHIDPYSRDI